MSYNKVMAKAPEHIRVMLAVQAAARTMRVIEMDFRAMAAILNYNIVYIDYMMLGGYKL